MKTFNFSKYPLSQFLSVLGSDSPAPGGGSAAALVASLGIALVEMVARINAKRNAKNSKNRIDTLRRLRMRAENLITQDAKAFMALSRVFKEARKGGKFQQALKVGARVPLEICEFSSQALQIALLEKNRTSRWLASDLVEAALLLEAAFGSGRLNVEINLGQITDKNFVFKIKKRLDFLEHKVKKNARKLSL